MAALFFLLVVLLVGYLFWMLDGNKLDVKVDVKHTKSAKPVKEAKEEPAAPGVPLVTVNFQPATDDSGIPESEGEFEDRRTLRKRSARRQRW